MNNSVCFEQANDPFLIDEATQSCEPVTLEPTLTTYEGSRNLAQLLAQVIHRSLTIPDVPETPPLTSEEILHDILVCTDCGQPLHVDSLHDATCHCSKDPCSQIPIEYLTHLVRNMVNGLAKDLDLILAILQNIDQLWIATRETCRQKLRDASSSLAFWTDRVTHENQLFAKYSERHWHYHAQDYLAMEDKLKGFTSKECISSVQSRLKEWETCWQQVTKAERQRVIQLLIHQMQYDRVTGKVTIVLQQPGWFPQSITQETCQ